MNNSKRLFQLRAKSLKYIKPSSNQRLTLRYKNYSSSPLQQERDKLGRTLKTVVDTNFLKDLKSSLPHLELNTNKYDLERHGKGESYHPSAPPFGILYPTSVEDISQIVRLCNRYHVPLIPFGTGTSVEGHVAALEPGSISLDMKEFKFIEDCSRLDDPCITVGAGVTRLELNDRLRHTGMQFMVDPGADASIGGMIG